jgi:hypothetical protein
MKKFVSFVFIALFLTGALLAAGIDGQWISERKMERDGQSFTITQTFNFKVDGDKLTGTLTVAFGDREPMTSEIKDGKIDGAKFSFTTVFSGPNGDMKSVYEGTLEGDVLKGTSTRDGGQARPFEAKRK